jgi:hypothetical protein
LASILAWSAFLSAFISASISIICCISIVEWYSRYVIHS